MSAAEDLDEAITDSLVSIDPEQNPVWEVADTNGADWAARKIAQARRRCAEAEAAANTQRAVIAEFVDAAQRDAAHVEEFFAGRLRRWHEGLLDEDPKRKTVKLPSGAELKIRAGRASVLVEDEGAFVEWARENNPDLLRTTVAPDKTAVAKTLVTAKGGDRLMDPSTAEVVPGVRQVQAAPSFSVVTPEVDHG
jgi:phage host-nuclease inhibitor protein Gam